VYSAFKDTLRGFLAFGVSSSLVSAIGFILIPLYTRYLSVSEFGLLGLVSLTVSICVAIFGVGLSSAIFRSYFDYDDPATQKELVGTSLLVSIFSSISLISISTIFAESLIAEKIFGLPGTGHYFQIALYTGAIGLLSTVPFAVYRAQRKFGRFAGFNITAAVLQMLLIIWLVAFLHYGLWGIIVGQFLAAVALNCLLLFSIRSSWKPALLTQEVKKLLSYGIPLVPGAVFYILMTTGSLYFVQTTQGLEEVGVFNLAIRIASVFTILVVSPFQLIWPPMMFSVEKSDYAEQFYTNILIYVLYISVVVGVALSLFTPEVIKSVATPEYLIAGQIVWLILLGQIVFIIQNVFNAGIILKRKTMYWSIALILETIASVLLWFLLTPRWGMIGIAVGSVLGYSFGAILTYLFSQRYMKIRYDWGRMIVLLMFFLLSIGVNHVLPPENDLFSLLTKTLVFLLLVVCPFLFRFWRPDEILAAKQLIRQLIGHLPSSLSIANK
jgi:O-antigen/teichoic acid export membrane protein